MSIDWDLVKILGCLLVCMVVWPDDLPEENSFQPPSVYVAGIEHTSLAMKLYAENLDSGNL